MSATTGTPSAAPIESPWWPFASGKPSAYLNRGKRFLKGEADAGRLRVAIVGARRERYTTKAWLDEWMLQHAAPVEVLRRRA